MLSIGFTRDGAGRAGRKCPIRSAVLFLLFVAAGCSSPSQLPERTFPLVELADAARVTVETDAIDIGSEAGAGALWSGWGPNESSPEGTFVWGAGERSLVRFEVVEPRDRTLRLRGWSYPFADASTQEVRLSIGGREVARHKFMPSPGTVVIEVSGDLLRAGENFLELRYARHAPGDLPWAAAWDGLRFDGTRGRGGEPRIDRAADTIVLPARTALEWTFEIAGGSWLDWKSYAATGDARLAISIVGEDGEREELPELAPGQLRLSADSAPSHLRKLLPCALTARAARSGSRGCGCERRASTASRSQPTPRPGRRRRARRRDRRTSSST